MLGYAATQFSQRALELMRYVALIVERFPEHASVDGPARCHEVARAVWSVLRCVEADGVLLEAGVADEGESLAHLVSVVDGRFGHHDHSWLRVDGEAGEPACVLDPYAVGRLPMVQLVDQDCLTLAYHPGRGDDSPWRYREARDADGRPVRRDDVRWGTVEALVSAAGYPTVYASDPSLVGA